MKIVQFKFTNGIVYWFAAFDIWSAIVIALNLEGRDKEAFEVFTLGEISILPKKVWNNHYVMDRSGRNEISFTDYMANNPKKGLIAVTL